MASTSGPPGAVMMMAFMPQSFLERSFIYWRVEKTAGRRPGQEVLAEASESDGGAQCVGEAALQPSQMPPHHRGDFVIHRGVLDGTVDQQAALPALWAEQ